jgi:hypothetical protein
MVDVAQGLWIWRVEHPDSDAGYGWDRLVGSTCVESGGEVAVLDGLAPPEKATEIWKRLDERRPTLAVVLTPNHLRDVHLFVRRYGCRAFGPWFFWRGNMPEVELEPIKPGSELPGRLVALYDGRGGNETPLWLPDQRTLVFADRLMAPRGELRVRVSSADRGALSALRALLDLPFERVIVSHGEPVHDRAAFEQALDRAAWQG